MLVIKYISASKETFKLLLNIQIILSSNEVQLLQFAKYFVKNLNNKRKTKF